MELPTEITYCESFDYDTNVIAILAPAAVSDAKKDELDTTNIKTYVEEKLAELLLNIRDGLHHSLLTNTEKKLLVANLGDDWMNKLGLS